MASVTQTINMSATDQSSPSPVAQPLLTVIVPVYNEVNTLETILQRVYESPVDKQIIVVDDGSTDGTADLLRQLTECSPIEAHFHENNCGRGRAIRTALEFARGQYTIIQDGDLEYDPQDSCKLLEPLLAREADVVFGSRYLNRDNNFSGRCRFDLAVKLLNFAVWLLYGVKVTDEATCYKVCHTNLLRAMSLKCERFEFCPEFTAKASRLGLCIRDVPILYSPRDASAGKKIRSKDAIEAFTTLWAYRRWKPSCNFQASGEAR
jgi:dolichol-phosphate mannosyltransferase